MDDTSPDARAVQIEAYRRMGGAGRAQALFRLCQMTRRIAEAGIRKRHPTYDDTQVLLAFARLVHGEELVRQAWPEHDLVDP